MAMTGVCLWCGRSFVPRRGGSEQRFCSPRHRHEFHVAARRFAERAIAAGSLTIEDLKNGDAAACTLHVGGNSASPALGQARDAAMTRLDALLDAIFDKLPEAELKSLPEVVWALFLYVDSISRSGWCWGGQETIGAPCCRQTR